MTYNLFIAYDLLEYGQRYEEVRNAIRELGPHHQFQFSLFYVNSKLDANAAFAHVGRFIDSNDKLLVIDARGGVTTNWDNPPLDAINAIWSTP